MRGSAHPIQVIAGARASGLKSGGRARRNCRGSIVAHPSRIAKSLRRSAGTERRGEDRPAAIHRVLEHPVS